MYIYRIGDTAPTPWGYSLYGRKTVSDVTGKYLAYKAPAGVYHTAIYVYSLGDSVLIWKVQKLARGLLAQYVSNSHLNHVTISSCEEG